jgi:hypothetical protein
MHTYETWPYYSDLKLYSDDLPLVSQVSKWVGCKRSNSYQDKRGIYAYDVIVAHGLKSKLAKLVKQRKLSTDQVPNRPVEAQTR